MLQIEESLYQSTLMSDKPVTLGNLDSTWKYLENPELFSNML